MQCKVPIKLYAHKKSCGGVHNIFEVVHSYLKKNSFWFFHFINTKNKGIKVIINLC